VGKVAENQESINRQSASHDAAQGVVNGLIQRDDFFEGESKEEIREEIRKELNYWTAVFKRHHETGRWPDWTKDEAREMED
jgi:hypothetical protein